MSYIVEQVSEEAVDFKYGLSSVGNDFSGNIVKSITEGLYRMTLPTFLQGLFEQDKEDIRRVIYTTNIVESVHRQFRTLTKTKGAFPNDYSLLKLLFMGIQNAQKKWTMQIRNWSLTVSQLSIHFEGRLDKSLNL